MGDKIGILSPDLLFGILSPDLKCDKETKVDIREFVVFEISTLESLLLYAFRISVILEHIHKHTFQGIDT